MKFQYLFVPAILASFATGSVLAAPAPLRVAPLQGEAPNSEKSLLAIAQQYDANIFVDSSGIDPAAPLERLDAAMRGPAGNVINALAFSAQERHLSMQKIGANSFAFWAEPDQDQLAQAIMRGEGFNVERGVSPLSEILLGVRIHADALGLPEGDAVEAAPQLKQIAARAGTAPQVIECKLSDLAPDLQAKIVALAFERKLGYNVGTRDYGELWGRDELWQRARIWFRPADPRSKTEQTLVMQVDAEDQRNRLVLSFFPSNGSTDVRIGRNETRRPMAPAPGLAEGQLRLLTAATGGAAQPVVVAGTLAPQGAGLSALQRANAQSLDLSAMETLKTPVSLEAVRQPLAEFLGDAARGATAQLRLSPALAAQSPLISARVQQLPLEALMRSVAHLYGAIWVQGDDQTLTLTKGNLSPLKMDLLRVGNFAWYRARDIVQITHSKRKADFSDLAAQIFDEAGPALMKAPGVALTSLGANTQRELRQFAKSAMGRRLIERQILVRDSLPGQWTLRMTSTERNGPRPLGTMLTLLVDGKPRATVRGTIARPLNNGQALPNMQQ